MELCSDIYIIRPVKAYEIRLLRIPVTMINALCPIKRFLEGDYIRPVHTQIGMNSNWYGVILILVVIIIRMLMIIIIIIIITTIMIMIIIINN